MKKPNPIFLGVIALAALLPHTPRLLPGVKVTPVSEAQSGGEMPALELPAATGDNPGCASLDSVHAGYEGDTLQLEAVEMPADAPAVGTDQNCDSHLDPSQQTFLSVHLASAPSL